MYETQRQPGTTALDSATHSKQVWEDGGELSVPGAAADADSGWMNLFFNAFKRSKNAMVLLDDQRRFVDVNGAALKLVGHQRAELIGRHVWEFVIGGPIVSEREWKAALRQSKFSGVGDIRRGDGGRVTVEFACHRALVTARQLVLFVAVTTNRRGRQPRGGRGLRRS